MSKHITIAARCAALSSSITQIITNASSFSRRLRESRHDINEINANLLAIKLALDITQNDFSTAGANLPTLLVEATAGFLDCCSTTAAELHKPIIRLSASDARNEMWRVLQKALFYALRQDLEVLRSAFDLVLDLVALINESNQDHSTCTAARQSSRNTLSSGYINILLRRIDVEREHAEDLTEGRLLVLYTSLDKLRACTSFFLEDCDPTKEPEEQSNFGADSVLPSFVTKSQLLARRSLVLPSPISTSNGIGAWIANVVSSIVTSPTFPVDGTLVSDSQTRAKVPHGHRVNNILSQGTFYAESFTTSGYAQSSNRYNPGDGRRKSRPRVDSPHLATKTFSPKPQHSAYCDTPTLYSDEDASVLRDKVTVDGKRKAKDARRRLTNNQRTDVDWDLANMPHDITVSALERILENGANPNVKDTEFGFLFIKAAYNLPTDILRLLVRYGADVTLTAHTPFHSAIHAAVLGTNLPNLQYLLSLDTPIDIPNMHGETPLHLAVKTPGAYEVAKLLLEAGADVNREAGEIGSPLKCAMSMDNRDRSKIVDLLFAHGAEAEIRCETPERRGKGLSILGLI